MSRSPRAFVLRQTRLRPVPGLEDIRLHLADEVLPLWHAVQLETGDPDAALPYWAFAWAGGLAISRYLADHPEPWPAGACSTSPRARGCARSPRCGPARRRRSAADIDVFAAAAIDAQRAGRRPSRRRRPARRPRRRPARCRCHPGRRLLVRRAARRAGPALARRAGAAGSRSSSATPAAATCRSTTSSSSPPTRSARRPSSRTSSTRRDAPMRCDRPRRRDAGSDDEREPEHDQPDRPGHVGDRHAASRPPASRALRSGRRTRGSRRSGPGR